MAGKMAARFGCGLILLHVQRHLGRGMVPEELEAYTRIEHVALTEAEMTREAGEELLRRAEVRARAVGATLVEATLEIGDPASLIVDHAKAKEVDMVVMGRRGLGAVGGILLGSVSHKVAQSAACACLTVP
jgi:nucleotide-binding universal stress UspA family protein